MINMKLVRLKLDIDMKKRKNKRSTWITEIVRIANTKCVLVKLVDNENGKTKRYYLFTRDMEKDQYLQYLRLLPKSVVKDVLDLLFEISIFN